MRGRAKRVMAGHDELPNGRFTKKQMFMIRFLAFGIILSVLAYGTNSEDRRKVQKSQDTETISEEEQKRRSAETITEKGQREKLQKAVDEINKAIEDCVPGIICWGDSLTEGGNVNYPLVLSEVIRENAIEKIFLEDMVEPEYQYLIDEYVGLIKTPEVLNMGVARESSITIVGRAGGIPYVTAEDIMIPEKTTAIELPLKSADRKMVIPQNPGSRGLESITISGVTGSLSVETNEATKEKTYYFTRMEPGDAVEVSKGTEIITYGSTHYMNYLPIIYIGTNGYYYSPQDLIKQQKSIINHQTGNRDQFIIVGLHLGTAEERKDLEKAMVQTFGDQYINLREYMSTSGIEDANKLFDARIMITDYDKNMIEEGETPASLMEKDEVHFNKYGYQLIGNLIYERMDQLGYFNELWEAIDELVY